MTFVDNDTFDNWVIMDYMVDGLFIADIMVTINLAYFELNYLSFGVFTKRKYLLDTNG